MRRTGSISSGGCPWISTSEFALEKEKPPIPTTTHPTGYGHASYELGGGQRHQPVLARGSGGAVGPELAAQAISRSTLVYRMQRTLAPACIAATRFQG